MMTRVKRILFRRSATRNMFRRRDSIGSDLLNGTAPERVGGGGKAGEAPGSVYRFVSAFPRAGGRLPPPGGSTVSAVPPAARIASAAAAEKAWTRPVSGRLIS